MQPLAVRQEVEVAATPVVKGVSAPVEPQKSEVQIRGVTNQVEQKPSKHNAHTRDALEAEARAWIFHKESTNRLDAVNSIGCYGLGQDCNDVLKSECPDWRTNRDCQVKFWDKYATRRYGSWTAAKEFWLRHSWW